MLGRAVGAAAGALVARAVYRRAATDVRWDRTNHRGEPLTLAEGPALAAGSTAGIVLTPALPLRLRVAAVLATGGAAGLGALDDLAGATDVKGLRGHLTALGRGEVTTGALKLGGLLGVGLASGALARKPGAGVVGGLVDTVLAGAVVAGSANLANLFDLRPGRAAKVYAAAAAPALLGPGNPGRMLAGPTGAMAATVSDDLGERSMMGDTGANALGAAWGVAAVSGLGRRGLVVTAAGLTALTLASERISFSQVIDETPVLRAIDAWGRPPAR